jgi:adenylate kinase
MKIIVITGPPYSGKGTQCELIEKEYGYKQISLGELCREEKVKGTEAAKIIDKQEETGDLVPNYIIKSLFTNALQEHKDKKGVIIDGYPRTIQQVDDLFNILKENNLSIDNIFNINVKESILLDRARERSKNSIRKDDRNPNIHSNRIKIFNDITKPGIHYMNSKQKMINFDGEKSIENVYNEIKKCLKT